MSNILRIKNIFDNLATIGESVFERDRILQLITGFGANYNSIVASLTTRENDLSLHSIHSILLTHEQRLCFQNTVPESDLVIANIATSQHKNNSNKRHNNRFSFSQNKNGPRPGRYPSSGRGQENHVVSTDCPYCQLCGKYGHIVHKCYHRFDINFQGYTSAYSSSVHNTSNDNNQTQVMVASPAPKYSETWFFDTGATHHLARDIKTLSDVQAYKGNEQVIVGNGKKLPILHTGSKFFSSTSINFHLKKVYHVSHLTTNLISVSKFCTDNNVFF